VPVTSAAPSTTAVPGGLTSITVESTIDQYFVLFVKPDPTGTLELPVSITMGRAGTTTITDGRTEMAKDRYRVATFSTNDPGDVDGDGVDDLTELADTAGASALNPGKPVAAADGSLTIPDKATYEAFSYQGDDVARDAYLAGIEFVKFWIVAADTAHPIVYFMNTERYRAHPQFGNLIGLGQSRGPGVMRGDIVYDPEGIAPDGSSGIYRFAFQPNDSYSFAQISMAYELLAANMGVLNNNLLYNPQESAGRTRYNAEKKLYDASRVPVLAAA
jgi:hypothetical protein